MHIGFRRRRRRWRRQQPRGTIQRDITFKRDFIYSADCVTPTPRYALAPFHPFTFSLTNYAFPDDTSCGYYPTCRPFPAVIPPTNRYQMGKIELVRATLVIIARPPISAALTTVLPLARLSRSYYFRQTYRARTGPPVIAVIFPTLISCKTFQLRSSSTSREWSFLLSSLTPHSLSLSLSFFLYFLFFERKVNLHTRQPEVAESGREY